MIQNLDDAIRFLAAGHPNTAAEWLIYEVGRLQPLASTLEEALTISSTRAAGIQAQLDELRASHESALAELDKFRADNAALTSELGRVRAEVGRLQTGRELECIECKTLAQIDTGRSGYEQGLERAAQLVEDLLAKKSYKSVGTTMAAAIRAEI